MFRAVKLFYITLQWWIHAVIHLSKPIQCAMPRVSPAANCGLWWTMMCQCRFIDDTERTSVVGDVSSDGGGACVGAGDMETLYIRSVLL